MCEWEAEALRNLVSILGLIVGSSELCLCLLGFPSIMTLRSILKY